MNKQEYDQGYSYGVASTLDQKNGAREAFFDRQKKEREAEELSRRVEAANREHEENERCLRERMREQERKQREYALAQQKKAIKEQHTQSRQSKASVAENNEWSTSAAIFGFIISAFWVAGQVQDAGDATLSIIIAGIFGAVVTGRFYKVIIGFSILIFILAMIAEL